MADGRISKMPPAAIPFQGNELLEVVQNGVNCKAPSSALNQTKIYDSQAPTAAGTITDFILPGSGDYMYDIDTTIGNIEIDGIVPQRDGQRVTFGNIGINNLYFGVGSAHGAAGHQIRSNNGPLLVLTNDCMSFEFCQALGYWVVS
jgi:hypothetical protein